MVVNVTLGKPASSGSFADIKLAFSDSNAINRELNLNVQFQSLYNFGGETNSVAFDLFLISSIVYGVDNLLDRYEYSIDAWARDIEICFPVTNLHVWLQVKSELESLLTFLTGDYWTIDFSQASITQFFKRKTRRRKSRLFQYDRTKYSFVSLFSGGLDSLIGVIDSLENLKPNEKGLLISHFDGTSPGANSDQRVLGAYLSKQINYRFDWIQEKVSLATVDNNGKDLNRESSFRSRSFLFVGIGVYCVEHTPNCNVLQIPENGTISINFPLTPSRSSTLSTRTTHPYYLQKLQELMNLIGLTTQLKNPYHLNTKGEMVETCTNSNVLTGIYRESVSCGKRGRRMHWDNKTGTNHCGVCMPCIYRRAALHKKGLDTQLYGIDIFTTPRAILSIPDMPALFDFLKRNLTKEEIQRTLLVNGSFDHTELGKYSLIVESVRDEIKNWIKAKGDKNLKDLAGVK